MSEVVCGAKHTQFQPTDEQWLCPGCGANNESFHIDENASDAVEGCEKIHDQDVVHCFKCGYSATGKTLSAKMKKKYNHVTCPTCKGHGTVPA